ncbi:hypothetical protein MTZ49_12185 [Entomomonas sp. E2T0]|uniref:hypothetical protein n=1 Tax=Entomomonas sp. E2T0 TaxID=2930213 RepID=UPI002228367E|nr:hypothetical protein [Entomomonas sp. E2T0]UYZ83345.1 hypothetical protein MTZ49_12170 [Entomomonas sp. E2T0]UYZ83348.1 hypothetical protein MTZ49_12185 [Entomomonas sp. E2T0]
MSITVFVARQAFRYSSEQPTLLITKCKQGFTLCIAHAVLETARGKIRYFKSIEAIANLVEYILDRKSFVFMYAFENN